MAYYRSGFDNPRTPTLDEIAKIFKVATGFRFATSEGSDQIEISFNVSREDCVNEGINISMLASIFLKETREHLDRLRYFDELTRQYHHAAGADTAACMAFVQAERKATSSKLGPESAIRNKMWTSVMHKLVELQAWRAFVDQEKMEKQRKEEEAKKRAEEEIRKQQERARQQYEQQQENESFKKNYEYYKRRFHEEAQQGFRDEWEDIFRGAFHGGFKKGDDSFTWGKGQEQQRRPGDKVKPDGKWFEVLGVPADSTKAVIKAAWRKLAAKYHPDRYKGPDANERMAEINAAKDVGLAGAAG